MAPTTRQLSNERDHRDERLLSLGNEVAQRDEEFKTRVPNYFDLVNESGHED
jgi:hypothetical protein